MNCEHISINWQPVNVDDMTITLVTVVSSPVVLCRTAHHRILTNVSIFIKIVMTCNDAQCGVVSCNVHLIDDTTMTLLIASFDPTNSFGRTQKTLCNPYLFAFILYFVFHDF